tara:strand:+ start:1515 stop:1826 length:312 start_codon:yes stop_codon:yes gene_type:complete
MKLAELSQKPKLIKLTVTNEKLVEKYGDELEFFVYDRQPLDIFTKLSQATEDNAGGMTDLIKDLILDEDGNKVIQEGNVLPLDVMMEAMRLVSEELGKSLTTK